MQKITDRIGHFLVTNTVWLFLTTITFIGFSWVMTFFVMEIGSLVYLVKSKWLLFGQFTVQLMLLFSPILVLSTFRNSLKKLLGKYGYRLVWFYSFLIHPIILTVFELNNYFSILDFSAEILLGIGGVLLLLELLIIANDYFDGQIGLGTLLQKMNLEKLLIISILLISFIISIIATFLTVSNGNNKYSILLTFLNKFTQAFIFQFIIYTFYLLNHYFLIEKIFKQKGLFYYIIAFIGAGMIFYPLFALSIYYLPLVTFQWFMNPESWIPIGERLEPFQAVPSYLPWLWMFISIPFILVYQWWKQKNDIIILEKEKSASELNALKQQVNPHFLFNTLNSLYALGIEEKGEKTADGIAKLGTLMRYNLNDAQKDFIALSKEIDYIKKYIELQELRITSNNELRINIVNTGIDEYKIAPLLLIPFIENAFKYGISTTEKTFLELEIAIYNNSLVMELTNTVVNQRPAKNSNGIGLSNTRKRLAALYPKQYELIIEETPTEFEVHLEIELSS